MLNFKEYPGPSHARGLLLVHGLFGSARNFNNVAKKLCDSRRVITVDLRNHGSSPWFSTNSYFDMANDLLKVITNFGGPFDIMGHSMGGKAAMVLAVEFPEAVNRLCVVDIAPIKYQHDQLLHIDAMVSVDLSKIKKRSDTLKQLLDSIEEEKIAQFLTQSLDMKNKKWFLNLEILRKEMPQILGFPHLSKKFMGPTLFLSGKKSNYVTHDARVEIFRLFPNTKFATIPNAGHWIHVDRPFAFVEIMKVFFGLGR